MAFSVLCIKFDWSCDFQKRENQKSHVVFACYGQFNPVLFQSKFGIKCMETASGSGGFNYVYLNIEKKRPQFICKEIQEFDKEAPENMKVKLVNLPYEQQIIGFGHIGLQQHEFYRIIKAAKEKKCISYRKWVNSDLDQDSDGSSEIWTKKSEGVGESSRKLSRLQHELGIDMVERQFKAQGSKRIVNNRTKLSSGQCNGLLAGGTQQYDPLLQEVGAGMSVTDDVQQQEQLDSNSSNLDEVQLSESSEIFDDVHSPPSPDGEGSGNSDFLAGFSPRTRALGMTLSSVLRKEFRTENASRTYLVEKVQAQEMAIKDHEHKRNIQEGKTAYQTRLANAAIRSEAIAKESLDEAIRQLDNERTMRENAQSEAGSLLLSNVSMSASIRDLSAGARVWICLLMQFYCFLILYFVQLSDWQLKIGYAHLERFSDLLRLEHLSLEHNRRSLSGVPPALLFSDTAFRRYYDHAMAYTDFKAASKSGDKHRLYLGFLDGPLFPEAVLYAFRERLMDQIALLCKCLGKEIPVVGEIELPIQGDPFDLEEVFLFLFYAGEKGV
jgi:hypothetical protein